MVAAEQKCIYSVCMSVFMKPLVMLHMSSSDGQWCACVTDSGVRACVCVCVCVCVQDVSDSMSTRGVRWSDRLTPLTGFLCL